MRKWAPVAAAACAAVFALVLLAGSGGGDEPVAPSPVFTPRGLFGGSLDINIGTPTATATATPTATPSGSQARLFVAASGCTTSPVRQSSLTTFAGAASSAKACSFAQALSVASCGDTVLAHGGSYTGQALSTGGGSCTGNGITMAAESGQAVVITDFALDGASNVRVAGQGWRNQNPQFGTMTIGLADPQVGSPDVRGGTNSGFDGIDVVTSGIIRGGTNVYFNNSDIGPYGNVPGTTAPAGCAIAGFPIGNEDASHYGPVNGFHFNGNYVHGFEVGSCSAPNDHLDCVHTFEFNVGGGEIIGNVFDDCENYGILVGSDFASTPENYEIADNLFGPVDTNCGLALRGQGGEDFSNVTIEYNSGTTCITTQTSNTLTNVVARYNAVTSIAPCRWTTSTGNKQSGGGDAIVCGSGDAINQSSFNFTNTTSGSLNFTPTAGSSLINAGPSTCATNPTDYFGTARPVGVACDIGAVEAG